MAEGENKGFFKSKAFLFCLAWFILGWVIFGALMAARPSMQHACEGWADEHGLNATAGEHGGHGEEHEGVTLHSCHLVVGAYEKAMEEGEDLSAFGFEDNLAETFVLIGDDYKKALSTAWAVPNFMILVAILVYFAGPLANDSMKTRKEEMEKAIKEAAEAKAEAVATKEEYELKLKKLSDEVYDIRQDIRKQAEAEKDRIVSAATELAQRIANEAEFTSKQELLMAQYKLREEAARLAIEVAEKVIREVISDQDRDRLIDEYLEKVMEQAQ